MRLGSLLQKSGLTERESALYLATLELGSGSVQAIARKSGIVRSTAYEVLESLREKRFVSTYLKKRTRYYSAEDPSVIVQLTQNTLELLQSALPELNAMAGQSRKRPTTRFYEGMGGIKTILNEILDEATELLAFASVDDVFGEIEDFQTFTNSRLKKKIPVRVIARDSAKARARKEQGSGELRSMKLVPEHYIHHGLVYIWKNKVAFFAFGKDPVATLIESQGIAETHRALFNNLWDVSS